VNQRQRVSLALAGVLCIVAVAWLFWPLPEPTGGTGRQNSALAMDCGNGLSSYEPGRGRGACTDLRDDRRSQVLILVGAGVAIGVGGFVLFRTRPADSN
jgi:hypothetical protein